jgi:hypothetical protein
MKAKPIQPEAPRLPPVPLDDIAPNDINDDIRSRRRLQNTFDQTGADAQEERRREILMRQSINELLEEYGYD